MAYPPRPSQSTQIRSCLSERRVSCTTWCGGSVKALLLWCIAAPFKLLSMVIAVLISPVASAWSIVAGVERLTGVLAWMQTADNSLDALWQQPQHLFGYAHLRRFSAMDFERSLALRWWARTLWLVRNPGAGLSDALGVETAGMHREVVFQRGEWDSGHSMCRLQVWRDGRDAVVAWQLQAQLFYQPGGRLFFRLNVGWKSVSERTRLIMTSHVNPFRAWRT